jgi:hypothetical protein
MYRHVLYHGTPFLKPSTVVDGVLVQQKRETCRKKNEMAWIFRAFSEGILTLGFSINFFVYLQFESAYRFL